MIKECHVSENLFDKGTATLNERVTTSGTTSYTGAFASDYISIGENVNCTVTGLITSIVTVIYFYDSSNTNIGYTSADSASSYSFTTPTGTAKLRFTGDMNYINSASVIINTWNTKSYCKATTGSETYSNFPIVVRSREQSISSWSMKGNEQHTGTASPTSPIEINGTGERTVNLLDFNMWYSQLSPTRCTIEKTNNSIKISATSNDAHTGNSGYHIPVSANTSYTFSYNSSNSNSGVGYIFENGVADSDHWHTFNNNNKQPITFTTRSDTTYIILRLGVSATGNYITYFDMMLNTGSTAPSSYEPYGYKIPISANSTALTPVYLTEQLMKINDYADSLASSGTVSRLIKKLVLTGQENWEEVTSGDNTYIRLEIGMLNTYIGDVIICTHCEYTNISVSTSGYGCDIINSGGSGVDFLTFRLQGYQGNTIFKQFLAQEYESGTPVTVYYVRATAETETVTVPTIPTTSSPTTIDVNTSVKPSEMSLTYDGYKICKEQKYQNNTWT